MPLTVGGGIRTFEDFRQFFLSGADKVSINSGAVTRPDVIRAAADHYGSQAVVLSIDVLQSSSGQWEVYIAGGRKATGLELLAWAEQGQILGAGEIVLNSINADGMKTGYDIQATRALARTVDIPVVASGGAGNAEHMREVLQEGEADAALAAGIFHSDQTSVGDVKQILAAAGVHVRRA